MMGGGEAVRLGQRSSQSFDVITSRDLYLYTKVITTQYDYQ